MAASAGGVYCRSRQFTVSASAERRRRRSTKSVTVASEAAPAEEGRLRLRWWRQMEAFVEDGWRRLNVGGVVVALNLLAEEMESRGNGGRLWGEGTENGENEVEIESRGESFMLERFRSLTEEALDKPVRWSFLIAINRSFPAAASLSGKKATTSLLFACSRRQHDILGRGYEPLKSGTNPHYQAQFQFLKYEMYYGTSCSKSEELRWDFSFTTVGEGVSQALKIEVARRRDRNGIFCHHSAVEVR
nr:putative embryo defective protein [Ipomoea batatas]